MPKQNTQFANPMLGGGDDLTEDLDVNGDEGAAQRVVASTPVQKTMEKVMETKQELLQKGEDLSSHIVFQAEKLTEEMQARGIDPNVVDPYARAVPIEERDQTDVKARAKFKAFVRETMLERIVFGSRDPIAEQGMAEAIWTGDAFDSDKKIQHPSGLWTGLLYPEASIRLWYDGFQLFAVCYTSVVVPLRLAFDETPEPFSSRFWFDVVIDSFFLFDIYLNFFAYVRNEATGQLLTDRPTLRRKYLLGYFTLDCLASNPIDYVMLAIGDRQGEGEARNMRLLRLMRTSRMASIHDFLQDKMIAMPAGRLVFKMFGLAFLIFGVAHVCGCLWLHDGIVHAGTPPHGSWIDHRYWYKEDSACQPDLESGPNPELDIIAPTPSFHVYHECIDHEKITQFHMYIESLYFSIVTMTSVGYGDITPQSSREKVRNTRDLSIAGM